MSDWFDVGLVSELVDRKAAQVTADHEPVLLLKVGEELFAIGNRCTHQGAGLDKGVLKIAGSVRTVTCPAHGSMFNLETGKVMRPPASSPVPVYDVKIEYGRVYVRARDK